MQDSIVLMACVPTTHVVQTQLRGDARCLSKLLRTAEKLRNMTKWVIQTVIIEQFIEARNIVYGPYLSLSAA